ncbi:MAG: endopeptidase, partial [Armatimonadota bacterium]
MPRLIAGLVMFPLLGTVANLAGVLGGAVVTSAFDIGF